MKIHLFECFHETAERIPKKVAIVDEQGALSFRELRDRAQAIAREVRRTGSHYNRPVAIFLPKTGKAIASLLGILQSGNFYVPLDIKSPPGRLSAILKNLQPTCIITDNERYEFLKRQAWDIPLINLDRLKFAGSLVPETGFQACIDADPAYIIHTSGSTGVPKGVVISHRSIFDYIEWAVKTFDVDEGEIIGNQAPLVFDNSTLDIYLMVFAGATLHLLPEELFIFPVRLVEYLNLHQVSFVFWVPSMLVNIANRKILDSTSIPSLKKVLFAGEVMPTKTLNYWRQHLSEQTLFANLYGPTEITVDCTYYIIDRELEDHETLPIGKACRNSDVLILNEQQELCAPQEVGELCVRGTSLALGYWKNPDKTREVFVQNPLNPNYPEKIYRTGDLVYRNENDEILFVGRKDNQIKHMGYRIELGEIEHAIANAFDGIIPCVLYDEQKKKLILVYEGRQEYPIAYFKSTLLNVLARYMIPSVYVKLEKLPLNSSGKIDRNYLRNNYTCVLTKVHHTP